EIACEGLRLDVDDDAALARARAFGAALARHALAAPLVLRMPLALAASAKDAGARWVLPVGVADTEAGLAAAARAAQAAGVAVEWSLGGEEPAERLAGLDRALAASRAAGLERIAFSVEAAQPVPAMRLVAAALRA